MSKCQKVCIQKKGQWLDKNVLKVKKQNSANAQMIQFLT